jgi:Ca2+-binding EF-hand superfamily protein
MRALSTPLLALLSAAAFAAPPSQFEGMDANRDGRIAAAEHAAAAKKMFQAMDTNRDGKVTAAEMDAAQQTITGRKPQAQGMSSAEKIKVVDRDGDGTLSAAEHEQGSKGMFEKMDKNRDGYLSKQEFDAGHAALTKKK